MVRKKDLEKIKEQIKVERKKKKKEIEPDIVFFNKCAIILMEEDLHIKTIYKLIKIAHIDQMLETMYTNTIEEYALHEPTVHRMTIKEEREKIESKLANILGKRIKIQV